MDAIDRLDYLAKIVEAWHFSGCKGWKKCGAICCCDLVCASIYQQVKRDGIGVVGPAFEPDRRAAGHLRRLLQPVQQLSTHALVAHHRRDGQQHKMGGVVQILHDAEALMPRRVEERDAVAVELREFLLGGERRGVDARRKAKEMDLPFLLLAQRPAGGAEANRGMGLAGLGKGPQHQGEIFVGRAIAHKKEDGAVKDRRRLGILPHRMANHGPGTSFYYRDPNRNIVELSASNFVTEAEYREFFTSEGYKRNPSGIEIEADAYIARYRSGVPLSELVKIPE